jgi:hypothetical protein
MEEVKEETIAVKKRRGRRKKAEINNQKSVNKNDSDLVKELHLEIEVLKRKVSKLKLIIHNFIDGE